MAWWRYYTPKPPKEVKGGIKAQSRRGALVSSWWGKRWIAVLESFNIGARLSRGRAYARSGQVVNIVIEEGKVRAAVQGSRSRPYKVEILLKPLSRAQWLRITGTLADRFLSMARLLAGEMPPDLEEVFNEAKLTLFPQRLQDLETDCTCPDWSNPCKHVAAVFYLLGEEFDRDPFLIFKLRGLDREGLFELLGGKSKLAAHGEPDRAVVPAQVPEPLSLEPAIFWGGQELPENVFGEVRLPPVSASLPKRLGSFPFWRAQTPFLEDLESKYVAAGASALDAFLGITASSTAEESVTARKKLQPLKEKKIPTTKSTGREKSVSGKGPKRKKAIKKPKG
jgi:uncharacterized Zn finger protein